MNLSAVEKSHIVFISKKLISFYKGCFNYKNSFYTESLEVIKDINYIREYGDITSVRRACNFLNNFYYDETKEKLTVEISDQKQKQLDEKNKFKKFSEVVLFKQNGKFIVEF